MADLGYIALLLAMAASVYSAIIHVYGGWKGSPALLESARRAVITTCALISLALGILLFALFTHDFQIEYVASYTSRATSIPYLISAVWAGNAGSLLFWAWMLSVFSVIALFTKRGSDRELLPYASPIMMLTEAFFLILLLVVANPFTKLLFTPPDGMGLNPMLQNPGMIVHPPAILAGYVLFTVPFAFAVAALIKNQLNNQWTVTARKWMLLAWLLLGAGNVIGAWWAYVELGWGGYWAWDPVENAGLMPWLIATAFLHSAVMQRRRGMFKVWSMFLIIAAFILAIFGTFLTRSGILSSVHTFGESSMGPFFVAFILIALAGSLGLLYYRKEELKSEAETEALISRESAFLLNNILLVGATAAILLGTVFPAISEAFSGARITVGAPFFNRVNVPLFMAIIVLAGICALFAWRKSPVRGLLRASLLPLILTIIIGIILFIFGVRSFVALIAYALCAFAIISILYQWFRALRSRKKMREQNYFTAFIEQVGENRPRYGGYIVHIAMALIAVGVIGSSLFGLEKEAILKPGESVTLESYTLSYEKIDFRQTPDTLVLTARLSVYNGGKLVSRLTPEKYFHKSFEQPVTEVAIRSTLLEDLYVILDSSDMSGTAFFKVLVNPMVDWIWIGGAIMILGGLIAFYPERRKKFIPASGEAPTGKKSKT